jgi:hypothetical protein
MKMTKHEQAKYLVKTKSRSNHYCSLCGRNIVAGDYYYKEQLDMRKPPSIVLKAFCEQCGLNKQLISGSGWI